MGAVSSKPFFSIIIVNYNGRELLKTSLSSLARQTFSNFEIIVVDNGSTDGSLEFVRTNYPQVVCKKCEKNNFSAANNVGITSAQADHIIILNNDVEVETNCFFELKKAIETSNRQVGMWATKILNFYRRHEIDNTGLLLYPDGLSRGRGRLQVDHGQYDLEGEAAFPSGCAGVYRKEALAEVGSFDEDFEFYVEDSDLGFRIRLAGWKCRYVPKAVIYHMYSASLGKYSSQKAYLVERNRIWLCLKNFTLKRIAVGLLYSLARYCYLIYGIIAGRGSASKFANAHSKSKLAAILVRSWISALGGMPRVVKKRKEFHKKITVSNDEIDQWFKQFKISTREISLID